MSVYLLHFNQPISELHTCQHYIGSVAGNSPSQLMRRIGSHLKGTGARLCAVARERRIGFRLARIWWEGDRNLEGQLKRRKNGPKLCPYCNGKLPNERPRLQLPTPQTVEPWRLTMSLDLNDYPNEIAVKRRQLLRIEQTIRRLSEAATTFANQIDQMVAFDAELSNETQRRAKKAQLRRSDEGYVQASKALADAQDQKTEIEIELQLMRDQFGLLKMQERDRIAQIERQWVA